MGSPVSDIQELQAINVAYGTQFPAVDGAAGPTSLSAAHPTFSDRKRAAPLLIGTHKPNVGHTEAASGLVSVIKVIMSLRRGEVPPTICSNGQEPVIANFVDTSRIPLSVCESARPLPADAIAAVNSFSMSGNNGHVIFGRVSQGMRGLSRDNASGTGGSRGTRSRHDWCREKSVTTAFSFSNISLKNSTGASPVNFPSPALPPPPYSTSPGNTSGPLPPLPVPSPTFRSSRDSEQNSLTAHGLRDDVTELLRKVKKMKQSESRMKRSSYCNSYSQGNKSPLPPPLTSAHSPNPQAGRAAEYKDRTSRVSVAEVQEEVERVLELLNMMCDNTPPATLSPGSNSPFGARIHPPPPPRQVPSPSHPTPAAIPPPPPRKEAADDSNGILRPTFQRAQTASSGSQSVGWVAYDAEDNLMRRPSPLGATRPHPIRYPSLSPPTLLQDDGTRSTSPLRSSPGPRPTRGERIGVSNGGSYSSTPVLVPRRERTLSGTSSGTGEGGRPRMGSGRSTIDDMVDVSVRSKRAAGVSSTQPPITSPALTRTPNSSSPPTPTEPTQSTSTSPSPPRMRPEKKSLRNKSSALRTLLDLVSAQTEQRDWLGKSEEEIRATPLSEVGLTSVQLMKLRNDVYEAFDVLIPATAMFDLADKTVEDVLIKLDELKEDSSSKILSRNSPGGVVRQGNSSMRKSPKASRERTTKRSGSRKNPSPSPQREKGRGIMAKSCSSVDVNPPSGYSTISADSEVSPRPSHQFSGSAQSEMTLRTAAIGRPSAGALASPRRNLPGGSIGKSSQSQHQMLGLPPPPSLISDNYNHHPSNSSSLSAISNGRTSPNYASSGRDESPLKPDRKKFSKGFLKKK